MGEGRGEGSYGLRIAFGKEARIQGARTLVRFGVDGLRTPDLFNAPLWAHLEADSSPRSATLRSPRQNALAPACAEECIAIFISLESPRAGGCRTGCGGRRSGS